MRIDVVTLFDEQFRELVDLGVVGKAIRGGAAELAVWNPRHEALDERGTVDDRPFGGGPGMVMAIEPLRRTLQKVRAANGAPEQARVSYLSPQGKVLTQGHVSGLAQRDRLILLCGRYEGIDERLLESEVDEEWSIGDYVLSGGELAAAVLIDAVVRLLPDVLGDEESALQDSFVDGLLDCPHYTRPQQHEELGEVPPVLLSGDHARIRRWRRQQSLGRTWLRRPDLLTGKLFSQDDETLLQEFKQAHRDDAPDSEDG